MERTPPPGGGQRLDCSIVGMMSSVQSRSTRSGWSSAVRIGDSSASIVPTTENAGCGRADDIMATTSAAIARLAVTLGVVGRCAEPVATQVGTTTVSPPGSRTPCQHVPFWG
jgi:hypothetical protein